MVTLRFMFAMFSKHAKNTFVVVDMLVYTIDRPRLLYCSCVGPMHVVYRNIPPPFGRYNQMNHACAGLYSMHGLDILNVGYPGVRL